MVDKRACRQYNEGRGEKDMKAIFLYITGTGNTRRVCEALAEAWRSRGHMADCLELRGDAPIPDLTAYDRIVFGYPVHAFNAPAPALNALRRFPQADGQKVWFVRTSGEPLALNDAAIVTPRRLLRKRGYLLAGDFYYVMPYNIIFRHSDGMAARMWKIVLSRVAGDAAAMEAGTGSIPRVGPVKRLVSFVLRIEHPSMPWMGKGFRTAENCIGCGTCAAHCPAGNIRMDGGTPRFGGQCFGCMACAFACPKDAVRIGILNGWRVNGGYDFTAPPATDEAVCRYCRRAYLRYFHRWENK